MIETKRRRGNRLKSGSASKRQNSTWLPRKRHVLKACLFRVSTTERREIETGTGTVDGLPVIGRLIKSVVVSQMRRLIGICLVGNGMPNRDGVEIVMTGIEIGSKTPSLDGAAIGTMGTGRGRTTRGEAATDMMGIVIVVIETKVEIGIGIETTVDDVAVRGVRAGIAMRRLGIETETGTGTGTCAEADGMLVLPRGQAIETGIAIGIGIGIGTAEEIGTGTGTTTDTGTDSTKTAEPRISYFGRVHFYTAHKIRDYEFLLAYVEDLPTGYVNEYNLAYEVPKRRSTFDYVDVRNIDEIVGSITTRERRFWINEFSCFWPALDEGYGYVEFTDGRDVFLKGRGLNRHRQPGAAPETEESESDDYDDLYS